MQNKKIIPNHQNKDYLYEEYIVKNRTCDSIAKDNKTTPTNIYYFMKKLGILNEENKKFKHRKINGLTKDYLIEEYTNNKKSLKTIAKIFGITGTSVRRRLLKFNIKIRRSHEAVTKYINFAKKYGKEFFFQKYVVDFLSTTEIGKEIGTTASTVSKTLRLLGIDVRPFRGCKVKDIVGKTYGLLSIIERDFSKKDNASYWKCQCKCGKICIISTCNLKHRTSCGCKGHRFGEISPNYWCCVQKGAKNRKMKFDLTIEYVWDLFQNKQNRKCALSGVKLQFKGDDQIRNEQTASFDRINSDKTIGYIEGNVQWIHKDLNFIKQDFTEEELFKWIKIVYEYNELNKMII